jgi:hypothetical protein
LLVTSHNGPVELLTDWRTLLGALGTLLWSGKRLWTAVLRCLEAMVRDCYRFLENCTRYKAKYKARAAKIKGIDIRFSFPYAVVMGEMRRAIAREQDERKTQDRFLSTLVIAAAIIAAVRLAREDISTSSPRLLSTVADSVSLAKMILKRVMGS